LNSPSSQTNPRQNFELLNSKPPQCPHNKTENIEKEVLGFGFSHGRSVLQATIALDRGDNSVQKLSIIVRHYLTILEDITQSLKSFNVTQANAEH
jgi:hypothetical protein